MSDIRDDTSTNPTEENENNNKKIKNEFELTQNLSVLPRSNVKTSVLGNIKHLSITNLN